MPQGVRVRLSPRPHKTWTLTVSVLVLLRESNEGWVGGEATGSPPCRKLFKTVGFESAVPNLLRDEQ